MCVYYCEEYLFVVVTLIEIEEEIVCLLIDCMINVGDSVPRRAAVVPQRFFFFHLRSHGCKIY